jgi:beta-1,4-mannosyl-glycoprotein beta-1,4-N-acetylglucosaminyltransferase
MSKLIDYFPYFAPYGDELLELRIALLKDHVDYFVISESDSTHSGVRVPLRFMQTAQRLNLPMQKIMYVPDHVSDHPEVLDIDRINTYQNQWESAEQLLHSQQARARERQQKDALLQVLHRFNDDDVFIIGDYDEIINPRENLRYIARVCQENPHLIYKLPFVFLGTRADLRVHDIHTGAPVHWQRSVFVATKTHLQQATPNQIRSEVDIPFEIHHITENEQIIQDLGWHFSWMGGADKRRIKIESYAHYQDGFTWMPQDKFTSFQDPRYHQWNEQHQYTDGSMPPSGDVDHVLRAYPLSNLPDIMLNTPHLKKFFLDA